MTKSMMSLIACGLFAASAWAIAQDGKPGDPKPGDAKPAQTAPAAGELVDNPLYKNWAQFKPGSFTKMKFSQEMAGNKTESIVTQTLKELDAEKAVVVIEAKMLMNGQENPMPPQTLEVKAKVTKAEADMINNPEGKKAEGEETLEVAGKKLKCKWLEIEQDNMGMKIKARTWLCDEVPGMNVQYKGTMEGEQMKGGGEGVVVEFKTDK
jgi:hypothetical protein